MNGRFMSASNPYAQALKGLEIPDPVASFFEFCRAREAVRMRRASGADAPWSDDPVLQRGRFLNVFREDDRSTQALMRFVAPVKDDLPRLVQALFFARWCNRSETLDAFPVSLLQDPAAAQHALARLPVQPWCNVTAYPVEPIRWGGALHSRLDTATQLFDDLKEEFTAALMDAQGKVTVATEQLELNLQGFAKDIWSEELEAEVARIHNYFPDPWRMIVRGGG